MTESYDANLNLTSGVRGAVAPHELEPLWQSLLAFPRCLNVPDWKQRVSSVTHTYTIENATQEMRCSMYLTTGSHKRGKTVF